MSDECLKCGGSGVQPNGWLLRDAREKPQEYNKYRLELEHGVGTTVTTLVNVVSPLAFRDDGRERCISCFGTGVSKEATQRRAQEARDAKELYFRDRIGGTEPIELPDGMMFLTITAYFNDSDSMSDYFAPHRSLSESYVVSVRKKGPRTEKAAREFVNSVPEFAKLSWSWHKQDYSGGHGTWLQSESIGKYPRKCYDGRSEAIYWYEISFGLYTKKGTKSKFFKGGVAKPAQAAESRNVQGVVVRRNLDKNGIEIVFPAKPSADVIASIKQRGFRWSSRESLWYRKFDENILKDVQTLFS
jgi:hypothetical protein